MELKLTDLINQPSCHPTKRKTILVDPSCPDGPVKHKPPRRVLHFSDGVLEEYSTDEEEEDVQSLKQEVVDPKTLSWAPWFWYWTVTRIGGKALSTCDYIGESIAHFLGITTPKYQYEIEEFNRTKKEVEAEELEVTEQMAGWSPSDMNESANVSEDLKSAVNLHPEIPVVVVSPGTCHKSDNKITLPPIKKGNVGEMERF